MDDDTKSKKHSGVDKQASIDAEKNSKLAAAKQNTGTVFDSIGYSTPSQTAIWTLYVFLSQCQTLFFWFLLENVIFCHYRIQSSLLLQLLYSYV